MNAEELTNRAESLHLLDAQPDTAKIQRKTSE
jgi:hypothetical protein